MFRSPQVRGSAQATAAPASVVTRLPDWVYRTIYYYGFRAARLVWRFTKPRHFGALVMLWHDKRVLLVRTSYQDGWVAPGGGIKADEAPVQAAIREASEELGLQLTLEDLRHALAVAFSAAPSRLFPDDGGSPEDGRTSTWYGARQAPIVA